jgi:hypothetical protein
MHEELENFERNQVGDVVVLSLLQTYRDEMGVEKQRGKKWRSGEKQGEIGGSGF